MKPIVLTAAAARDLDNLPSDARRQVSDGLIGWWPSISGAIVDGDCAAKVD
jgi:hypothetical protein